jgi:hypothetical protein
MNNPQDIPVLLIVFNRVGPTKSVVDRLREIKPRKLYIAADGPRANKEEDFAKTEETRRFLDENIDWECEVKKKYSEKNLGCKYNPQDAIDWLFAHEEEGIILEDDCIPNTSFFDFCFELLERYRHDLRVFGITGTSVVKESWNSSESYYFSEYVQTWGWATWKDRWQMHQSMMEDYTPYLNAPIVGDQLQNKEAISQIRHRAKISYEDKTDAWDYIWFYSAFVNNGLFIVPTQNLIMNDGFNEDATHTFNATNKRLASQKMSFPLNHPPVVLPHLKWDDIFYKQHYNWRSKWQKLRPWYIKNFLKSRLLKGR